MNCPSRLEPRYQEEFANFGMRILTNIIDFPKEWSAPPSGIQGTAEVLSNASDFVAKARTCDAILINCDPALTYKLGLLFLLLPGRRKPIIALDLVLRKPTTLGAKFTRAFKKVLLKRVHHFIHYFRQLDGYDRYFGIGSDRSSYVPFKVNLRPSQISGSYSDGDYVLCFGRSERDYDTFFAAMATLPYPGAVPAPDFELLRQNSSRFTLPLAKLPPNVRVLENEDTPDRALEIIANARIVALPIVSGRISASGIGTYLTAMVLGKCVIVTEGPGSSDVLTDQALIVPAGNSAALASAIRLAWEDSALRERVATAGRRYALACGVSNDLYDRVLRIVVNVVGK